MSLKDRLHGGRDKKNQETSDTPIRHHHIALPKNLKTRLHAQVIDKIDMRSINESDPKKIRERLNPTVQFIVDSDNESSTLTEHIKLALIQDILDEIVGFGPLEELLNDPDVSDILVNNATQVFAEKKGKLELTQVQFNDNSHLLNIIQRIVSRVGRRVDESSPLVDARLQDGSRVNAVVQPIAIDGPILSIRRFGKRSMGMDDLLGRQVLTQGMANYLRAAVIAKSNLLVSGGTGAGKTTLLNILSSLIPGHERVITIEDSAELSLQGQHVVRMESRPANIEGHGEVSIRACVKNALRMRPDRVVIGEVRGSEVLDMLQAMNTGHEGSMATVHANNPKEAVDRLMMMLALSGSGLSSDNMAQFIARSVRVVVQVARFPDGARRITGIAELGDFKGDRVDVHDVFSYSNIKKSFIFHQQSLLLERFKEYGLTMDLEQLAL